MMYRINLELLLFYSSRLYFHSFFSHIPLLPRFPHHDQNPCRGNRRAQKLHGGRARQTPDLDTHAASWRPGECQQPFNISRNPPGRHPEQRPFSEPELKEEAQAVG